MTLHIITDRERALQEEVARLQEVERRVIKAQQDFYTPNAQLLAEGVRLREIIAEQLRTITALNLGIGGEGSTTTENLKRLGRLDADNAELRKSCKEWLKANGPGGWIDIIRADNERLRAELAVFRAPTIADEIADACRVMAWANTPNRRPANLAFTAGPERQAAYWIGRAEQQYALRAQASAPVVITDDMALAFHRAIGDGSIGQSEVDEIKAGLAAAFANHADPQPRAGEPVEFLLNGARMKLSFQQVECEDCGSMSNHFRTVPLDQYAEELQGRWVALVPAENDRHLRMIAPPAAELDQDSALEELAAIGQALAPEEYAPLAAVAAVTEELREAVCNAVAEALGDAA